MSRPASELRLPDGTSLDTDEVVAALLGSFDVSLGPATGLRRVRLDTFDRRLAAAGMLLEQVAVPREPERLVLTRGDGSVVRTASGRTRWPTMAGRLPASPVRDEVAEVSGLRALMVTADERRKVRPVELRNHDGKIVVRLEVDEPTAADGRPVGVRTFPLRGYDAAADRAVSGLRAVGFAPVAVPVAPSARPAVDVSPKDPAALLLGTVLGDFRSLLVDNVPGMVNDVDTEFLHDFRVAVRRTRAALKLGRPALPDRYRSGWEPELKWLGDITSPVRDLDVYELDLPEMAGWLVAAKPDDLTAFHSCLRRRRQRERRTLLRHVRSTRFTDLLTSWEEEVGRLTDGSAGSTSLTAGRLARVSIGRAYRRVHKLGDGIGPGSSSQDMHTLRKRCKELRYALDLFAPVIDVSDRKKATPDLKALQNVLGRYQDAEVQRGALREFADEMVADGTPAPAILAMGELIGHLEMDQDRARREFDDVYARFARRASERRFARLGGRP